MASAWRSPALHPCGVADCWYGGRAGGWALDGLRRLVNRDPESQAFIESWFGKLTERCAWQHEFETLDYVREVIGAYVIH